MAARQRFAPCHFLAHSHRANLPRDSVVHDISSYADYPYCTLSQLWVHGGIPVPGMSGVVSDSIEGIWQGLKVIRGKTAPHLFRGRGRKRGGKPAGHRYGDRLLGVVEARSKIYQVAYEWVLGHRVDRALIEGFVAEAFRGVVQHFHDVGDNGDLGNVHEPLAHAAVLVRYLNRLCGRAGP